ncbi:MAG TPA: ribosome small subunit-dependent GTPase A [Steroidobacteraceae bacterium]
MTAPPTASSPPATVAQVVACHGRLLRLRLADGSEMPARALRRDEAIVCGDEVSYGHDLQHGELRITRVHPRRTALFRSSARGEGELVAANLTLLVVVIAPVPQPDLFVVDRYLAAARSATLRAVIVLNKCELGCDERDRPELEALAAAGYPLLPCSARLGTGLTELTASLHGECALLVGQSGVGKSSLLAALIPGSAARVGELVRREEGRHTTTTARMHQLQGGGALIDSPGVRDFAPAIARLTPPAFGFVEIERLAPQCRFADCRHLQEPDCAVRAAVAARQLSPRRYESYRRLQRLVRELAQRQGR